MSASRVHVWGLGVAYAAAAAIVIVQLACVFATPVLPFSDGPNHIAAAFIKARLLAGDAFFAEHYELSFAPMPYWINSLWTLATMPVLGAVAGYKLLTIVALVLQPIAWVWMCRQVAPAAAALVPVVAVMAFHSSYWAGYSHVLIGMPMLLAAIGLFYAGEREREARTAPRPWRIALFALLALGVYFSHVFLLAVLVGVVIVTAVLRRRASAELAIAGGLFALACYFVLFHAGGDAHARPLIWALTPARIAGIAGRTFGVPGTFSPWPARAFAFALAALLGAPVLWRVARRPWDRAGEGVHVPLAISALGLFALTLVLPVGMADETGRMVDDLAQRFEAPAVLLALAAFGAVATRAGRLAITTLAIALALVILPPSWDAHREQAETVARLRTEIWPHVPHHARVLSIQAPDSILGKTPTAHRRAYLGCLLTVEREAYTPEVFARRGQQPLAHRLRDCHRYPTDCDVRLEEWSFYDLVLVQTILEAPEVPGLDSHARLVARTEGFALYETAGDDGTRAAEGAP